MAVEVVAVMGFSGIRTSSHTLLGITPSRWSKLILASKTKARSLLHRPPPMLVSTMVMVGLRLLDSSTSASFLISIVKFSLLTKMNNFFVYVFVCIEDPRKNHFFFVG